MACQQASSAARDGGIVQCQMPRKVQTEQLVGCAQHYGVQDQRVQIPQHPVPGQLGEAEMRAAIEVAEMEGLPSGSPCPWRLLHCGGSAGRHHLH